MFVQRKAIVFYFEYRARIAPRKSFGQRPRGSGNGSFTVGARVEFRGGSALRRSRGRENEVLPVCGYLPAPTGGKGRGGKDKIQRNREVLQKRVRILKMGTVAITGVYARGLFHKKND